MPSGILIFVLTYYSGAELFGLAGKKGKSVSPYLEHLIMDLRVDALEEGHKAVSNAVKEVVLVTGPLFLLQMENKNHNKQLVILTFAVANYVQHAFLLLFNIALGKESAREVEK